MVNEDHDVPVPDPIEEQADMVDDEGNKAESENREFYDYTPDFTTSQRWSDRDPMIKHIRDIALGLNMVLTIKRSWGSTHKRRGGVLLACEKHETYKPRKRAKVVGNGKRCRNRRSISKLEECPFALSGVEFKRGEWGMVVLHGTHNHVIPTSLEVHSFVDRQVETTLTNKAREERTITREGLHLMRMKDYFCVARNSVGEVNRLQDLFLVHPEVRQLLNVFPYSVIIDNTYKMNEYGIPLCEFIGFTCTGKNFNIAFCFMSRENTETYSWALQQLMYILRGKLPNVIVTDRELGLIAALKAVVPHVRHMLCKANVLRECEEVAFKKSKDLDVARRFQSDCRGLFESRTIDTFNARRRCMHAEWGHIKGLMSYLEVTWLRDYTKNIVCAYTDSITHFGTRTTNRVESAHSVLKNALHSSVGDFTQVLKAIDLVIKDQMKEVKITMGQAYNIWPIDYHGIWMFDRVRNMVSKECFNLLFEIYTKMETDPPSGPCRDRYWRYVYGLPCTHEMQACRDAKTPIRPSQIHPFWKQLDWNRPVYTPWVPPDTARRPVYTPWVPPDPARRPVYTPWVPPDPARRVQSGRSSNRNPLPRNSGTMPGHGRERGNSSSNEQVEIERCKEGTSLNVNQIQQTEIRDDIQGAGGGRGRGRGQSGSDNEVRVEHNTIVSDVEEIRQAEIRDHIQGVRLGGGCGRGQGRSGSNNEARVEHSTIVADVGEIRQAEIRDDIQGVGGGRGRGRGRSGSDNEVRVEHSTTVVDVGEIRQAEIRDDIQGVGGGHGRGRGQSGSDNEVRVEHSTTIADVGKTNGPQAAQTTLPEADIIHLGFNWGTNNIDEFMIGFIRAVTNVTSDGHCGYRSLACLLNMGQEAWPQVRRQLLAELQLHADRYHYYPELEELIMKVNYYRAGHDANYWMEIPIMGEVFATVHQRPLVILSQSMPMLCLPLYATSGPSLRPYHEVDGIALIGQSNHFVPIWLLPGSPLPPIYTTWTMHHHPSVNGWDEQFSSRIARYRLYRRRDGGHPSHTRIALRRLSM